MPLTIPEQAVSYGFVLDGLGAHSSRTIMLSELRLLLGAFPNCAGQEEYRLAILEENVLLKHTDSTRKESFRRLRELYALSGDFLIFRALRDVWAQDPDAQPMVALLCAIARDPILRATGDLILRTPPHASVTPQMISRTVDESFPGRFNETTLANFGRHIASSWTQSGHLKGRTNKIRATAECHPTSVAYSLFLGYLTGLRGDALFDTLWCQLLDAPPHVLHNQAVVASQHGWLEYRHSGGVTDVSFRYLLREKGLEGAHERNPGLSAGV